MRNITQIAAVEGVDVVVPPPALPELMAELVRMSERFGVTIPSCGHTGDGNLHGTVVKDSCAPDNESAATLPKILTER